MTTTEKIDAALDSVLRASGSMLKHYTMVQSIDRMREAMRKIVVDSYTAGKSAAWDEMRRITGLAPNDAHKAMKGK